MQDSNSLPSSSITFYQPPNDVTFHPPAFPKIVQEKLNTKGAVHKGRPQNFGHFRPLPPLVRKRPRGQPPPFPDVREAKTR